jgi:hypothetical protein
MNIRTLPILAALVALPCMAAVNLMVPVSDFSENRLPGVLVTLQRIPAAGQSGGSFVSAGPQTRRTDAAGVAYYTNVVSGTYRLTVAGDPARVYEITIPDAATGTTNALNFVTKWPAPLP